ncbi:MAG: methylmalonyl Co-A mutase-associated GTPase MeaB [Anaerolineaceae bacterium]
MNGQALQDEIKRNRLTLARLITEVENDTPSGRAALEELYPLTGKAHIIGITGAPGVGKSSLVNQLALAFRHHSPSEEKPAVAIIAIDPSSPFTGGAILGDRIRMRDLSGDPGIFIRSMAARGAIGGLARSTAQVARLMDAAGYKVILIETVGAGQAEVEIASLAHTTIVVDAPGLGDDIQAIKAGILEIADILVVNKADLPGVENTERALQSMLLLANSGQYNNHQHWDIPIIRTIASHGDGALRVMETVQSHLSYLKTSGEWEKRERLRIRDEVEHLVIQAFIQHLQENVPLADLNNAVESLFQRETSPYQEVQKLLRKAGINT